MPSRVWHSWKLCTNECPNIFVSTKLHQWISEYIHINFFDTNECPNKYLYWKLHEYSNIFEYSSRFYTLTHSPTNVRIYSYKQIRHERMSEYIRKRKIDTNECPNIYSWPTYSNIRIYSSHSELDPIIQNGKTETFYIMSKLRCYRRIEDFLNILVNDRGLHGGPIYIGLVTVRPGTNARVIPYLTTCWTYFTFTKLWPFEDFQKILHVSIYFDVVAILYWGKWVEVWRQICLLPNFLAGRLPHKKRAHQIGRETSPILKNFGKYSMRRFCRRISIRLQAR